MDKDGTVASSMRARAILSPKNRGRMAGLASRASHADTGDSHRRRLDFCACIFGGSRLQCMKNGGQNIGIDGIVAAGVGACHPKPSKAQAGWPGWLCERRPRA